MTDQNPVPQEMPKIPAAETEKSGKEKENFETVERKAESASREEVKLIDELATLRSKMAASGQNTATTGKDGALVSDIEARKEKIIANFVAAARAADFNLEKVERIMHIAERYLRKDYPDIADEIHDRIANERNQ